MVTVLLELDSFSAICSCSGAPSSFQRQFRTNPLQLGSQRALVRLSKGGGNPGSVRSSTPRIGPVRTTAGWNLAFWNSPSVEAPPTAQSSTTVPSPPSVQTPTTAVPPASPSDPLPNPAEVMEDGRRLRVGWHCMQGLREEMEDDVVVVPDAFHGFLYGAVFDGHVGKAAVNFLKEELFEECKAYLKDGDLLNSSDLGEAEDALEEAFLKTDERLLEWLEQHSLEPDAGSTATAVFARHDRVFVAHLGDSRAVLAQGGSSEELSEDHRLHGGSDMAKNETQRIKDAGGWVAQGRVCGVLAVSRAFGNRSLKTRRDEWLQQGLKKGRWTKRFISKLDLNQAWLSALPDVYAAELADGAEFIVVASDGVWDGVRSSEAVRFVRDQLNEHGDLHKAAQALVEFAINTRKSEDNASCLIICFD